MMAFSGAFRSFLKVYAAVAVCALLAVVVSRYDFGLHLRPRVLYAGVAGIHYNEKLCL